MSTTPRHSLNELAENQDKPYIKVNETLQIIDAKSLSSIEDRDLTTPPAHVHGKLWIVADSATGAWADHDLELVQSYNDAWFFYVPEEGWIFGCKDENDILVYDGAAWKTLREYLGLTEQTALTASNTSTVDGTYGSEEAGVINNLRTRVDEIEDKLQALGLLA
jgi:hypothetical protein